MFLFINKMTINVCLTHISLNLRKSIFFKIYYNMVIFKRHRKTFAMFAMFAMKDK